MKRGLFLASMMFFVFQIFGFEMKYNSYGENLNIPGVFDSPDGIHEKITKTAVSFLCEANDNGLEFINNNLSQFVDVSPISDCDELANSSIYDGVLYSLLRGVRYNDAPEVDGFTAMSDHGLYNWANTVDDSCNNAELCVFFPITCAIVCGIAATSDFDKNDFLISEESDLSNEYLYPLMHAQLNNRNFGNNPHLMTKVMRNYIKSYFYELLLLSLTEEKQFQNYFISYDDVDQHSSSSATEYKEIDYKKVILGELFHTIEDSFAHNIRYLEDGKLKIGAILNMDTTLFGEFKHDKYFPINKNEINDYYGLDDNLPYFNCKDVDGIFNFNFDDEIENGMPLNLQDFDGSEIYFWQNFYKGKKVVKEGYASTMAVYSISEFLWILGKAVETPNDKNYTDALINNYLNKWFSGFEEGETPFFDLDLEETKDLPEEYELIGSESRWENFYNVDLWEHSFVKDRTVNFKKAVFLPWIDIKSRKRDRLSVEDQSDRFVFKTVENDKATSFL